MGCPLVTAVAAAVGLVVLGAPEARAQAWTPPKGEASVDVGYAFDTADEHIDSQGNVMTVPSGQGWGTMTWNDAALNLGYGITDRWAVRVGLPFVVSKYEGQVPHPPMPGHQNQDDGKWYDTFGDFAAEVRFKTTLGSFVVTPLLGLTVPSHSYEFYAHAAAGRGLTEGRVGVNVGRLLDPLLPNAYAQVRYVFSVPERPLGIWHNRSNLSWDVGYLVTKALTIDTIGEWEKTHGGWRAPVDFPMDQNFLYHDQLQRSDYIRLGGGISYALSGSVEVAAMAYTSLHVRSEVNMGGVALNFTYSFSPAQAIRKRQGPPGRPPRPS